MRNVTEIQQRLIALKYLPKINAATGKPNDDGTFGRVSLDAYNRWRAAQSVPLPPITKPDMLTLNADLFPEERPVAPAPKPSLFDQIGAIASIIKTLKGLTMTSDNSTSATVDVKSAWLSKLNWTMVAGVVFNVFMLVGKPVPADVQAQVITLGNSALFVLGYVIKTFFTKTITPSSAAKI